MKDFIKWLGVNEKIAKVVVWMFLIMISLIIINTFLRSLELPHYAITPNNIQTININKIANIISNCIICVLNFYVIVLLVFKLKELKPITKYALLYMISNWIVYEAFGYVVGEIFIILYILIFCYLYSNKSIKHVIYGILSIIFNIVTQGVWYSVKASMIDYTTISGLTKTILSIDYFIIMAVIILVKEIYLKKRGVING